MNLTLGDMLRVVNGIPKKDKDITLAVNGVLIDHLVITKDKNESWYVDMRTSHEE